MRERTFSKILRTFIWGVTFSGLFFSVNLSAQERTDEKAALEHIKQLKEGHVIVVLPSHLSKLNQLHRMRASPKNSERARKRYDKMYSELVAERDTQNRKLVEAFELYWTFCPHSFIYDFQLRYQPPDTNLAKVEPLPSANLPGSGYRIRLGTTESTSQFGVEALIFADPGGNDLKRPFPFYVKLNKRSWFNGLVSIFFPSAYTRKDEKDLVRSLNERVTAYYEEEI